MELQFWITYSEIILYIYNIICSYNFDKMTTNNIKTVYHKNQM